MTRTILAHTNGNLGGDGEPLATHHRSVSVAARRFAEAFGSGDVAEAAGAWHDLGKYHPEFQKYIRGERAGSFEHSGAGAALAVPDLWGATPAGIALAFAIAGHHAGLANLRDDQAGADQPLPLSLRLENARRVLPEVLAAAEGEFAPSPVPEPPAFLHAGAPMQDDLRRRLEFWTRMLFSALVDADRICTEAFCNPAEAAVRAGPRATVTELRALLEAHYRDVLGARADGTPVGRARAEVAAACIRAAGMPQGLFSLTVPTGGGKTLAAMRFALAHAERHGLARVIVVIPFTSIIEQNAHAYRLIFGEGNVVEHHSNLDPALLRSRAGEGVASRHEFAVENWDAPVIVTTTVQFFESLFSNHPSRCRKLHHIAGSVVILDEVQALPPELLAPMLDGLRELAGRYGTSIVLSTATPPALGRRPAMTCGLEGVRPIIEDPSKLALDLRRVRYEWPAAGAPPREWGALAAELAGHERVLAVVHRRADARELAMELRAALPAGEIVRHLSALMCPAHRLEVLGAVRADLEAGRPCRLVSTQLIEAGVDVDFPVVYKAFGGLDSIVQAAGRCNREGLLEYGRVVVFESPTKPPRGNPAKASEAARAMFGAMDGSSLDPDDPARQEEYFRRFYSACPHDAKNIQMNRAQLNFATVARDFRMIEDGFTRPVIIPWRDGARRLEDLRRALRNPGSPGPPLRELFRMVQPFTVTIYADAFDKARGVGAVQELADGCGSWALEYSHMNHYSEEFGLVIGDDIAVGSPESFMA